tara:strand:- start:1232 stop:1372 length:141 start_codon:yes stop_codon:yes gene_type:complete
MTVEAIYLIYKSFYLHIAWLVMILGLVIDGTTRNKKAAIIAAFFII